MLVKLNIVDLHEAIKNKLENKSNLKAFDVIPLDESPPFLHIQYVGKSDSSTKTMYIESFTFHIHGFSEGESSQNIYNVIEIIEEALTENIVLGKEYMVVNQTEDGIIQLLREDTGENHVILQYTFKICYGFKCKA